MTTFASPRRAMSLLGIASLLVVPLLAGCGSSQSLTQAEQERSTRTNVPFNSCSKVRCSGQLGGAAYEIKMPDKWNGTLLLYSHGYRPAEPAPPDFAPVDNSAVPAPGQDVATQLLSQGYALAGSAFKTQGWDVLDGVAANEQLHSFFVDKVGKPDRVYVWGDSLGGLITQTLAEKHPEWISGVAPLCGVLAGTNLNLDLALDVAYAVKTLIYPQLKLTGFASHDEAVANWQGAYDAITKAGGDIANGVPKILLVAALADAPSQTKTYDGSTVESQVRARAESILTALGYGTFGRYEIEQRVGGNPSSNEKADYTARVNDGERSLIETVSPGSTDKLLAQLNAGQRVTADPAARAKAEKLGDPTGNLQDPTITMHTKADPLVLAQNETVFAHRAQVSKKRTADLVQFYTLPPTTYSATSGAPYGAGHCNFTTSQRVGIITLLDDWVHKGTVPVGGAISKAFGDDPSVTQLYNPGPWPAEAGS
ncbi:MAG: alpha/beta hydrolase family protein [Actinomycetes bacterium]